MVTIVRDRPLLKVIARDNPDFKHGLDLFNQGRFFDAHEVLEDLWRPLPRHSSAQQRLRLQVQGMIQIAVAFHHESTGNRVGAHSVLQRALRNIRGAERSFPQLDFDRLRAELALWERYLERSVAGGGKLNPRHPAPALPKITRTRKLPG
jgi:predicted metal-dependent hydrolase